MKKIITLCLGALFAITAQAQNEIVGKWNASDGEAVVEMYQSKGTYSGKIIWLKNGKNSDGTDKTDSKNPDKSKRNKTIKGLNIVSGLKYDGSEWDGGKVYDPESGRTYKCSVRLEGGKLKLKGKWGPFSRTQTWTRHK